MIDPALLEHCAPNIAAETMHAIIAVESAGNPLALNINGRTVRVATLAEATEQARQAIAAGSSVDMGLMQINSRNLSSLGLSVEQVFQPCANLQAGAAILSAAYDAATAAHGEGQPALRAALSYYNTGSYSRGFANGYVARFYSLPGNYTAQAIDYSPYSADSGVFSAAPPTEGANMSTPQPIISRNQADFMTPGVQVELTAEEAEALGADEEPALTPADAWESNGDEHTLQEARTDGR